MVSIFIVLTFVVVDVVLLLVVLDEDECDDWIMYGTSGGGGDNRSP